MTDKTLEVVEVTQKQRDDAVLLVSDFIDKAVKFDLRTRILALTVLVESFEESYGVKLMHTIRDEG